MAQKLTKKDQAIALYGEGRSAHYIVQELGISLRTVNRYIAEAETGLPPLGNLTRRRLRFMMAYESDFNRLLRLMSVAARYDDGPGGQESPDWAQWDNDTEPAAGG